LVKGEARRPKSGTLFLRLAILFWLSAIGPARRRYLV
jgi:hypothetical protein